MLPAQKIKSLLEDKGQIPQEFAKRVGLGAYAMTAVLSGDRQPSIRNGFLIADALGVSCRWLFSSADFPALGIATEQEKPIEAEPVGPAKTIVEKKSRHTSKKESAS